MWPFAPTSSAALNPKFREVYTCVFGPNGPEYSLQGVQDVSPGGPWGAPHWGPPQGPLSGGPPASPRGGGPSRMNSSACAAEFGASFSAAAGGPPSAAAAAAAPLGGTKRRLEAAFNKSEMKQQRLCGMWHVA
ncbi:hypothetical protein, conserved [Eimeria tenella]|uniref:Uncharacterized protein n=1 Tax=Eimeria tenella TaxID=5802 RepID=U6L0I3_EIMTE|nr:hypothetical protein, conserved [Eimeria tenella]CDJ42089.1 hypothetical protein, conserved [Eimeria tenella]|eukprot:XP_013232839.1 hypothetical protein, conserved [Eimeria tenella]